MSGKDNERERERERKISRKDEIEAVCLEIKRERGEVERMSGKDHEREGKK